MNLAFPSPEFDDAVAAVCHGSASEPEMRALNNLLRNDLGARDEYLLRVELHSRLASNPDLFTRDVAETENCRLEVLNLGNERRMRGRISALPRLRRQRGVVLALAAGIAIAAGGVWKFWFGGTEISTGTTSSAVAVLTQSVDARWSEEAAQPAMGSALEPGWLRLQSGLAQVVFYSGARVVIEGPAALRLVSPTEAVLDLGRLLAEVPEPARGFHLETKHLSVVDLGTSFGIEATQRQTEVHVFQGEVKVAAGARPEQTLQESQGAVVQADAPFRLIAANAAAFSSMFSFQQRSTASEAFRYEQWQFRNARLNQDPSLLVHLAFEDPGRTEWTLANTAAQDQSVREAVIVGCARTEGRWPEKPALEFQTVNDRVRLVVPGEFESLTLSAWVCVLGLDRQFNSLFMCDGFAPGTIHWLIRNDGVLGVTVFGEDDRDFQIFASPRVLTLDQLGMWLHLAVVLDGASGRVVHYLNGELVSEHALRIGPPFRIGAAELGNWNAQRGPEPAPALIRNLSGAFDEFDLFQRALSATEIHELYAHGRP
ncbi:MAG: FecR domain-containing protein [Verrucomicrobiales bacterium]|nr:FecR domain-containing protein [Verrucomicrobiales bacterium]